MVGGGGDGDEEEEEGWVRCRWRSSCRRERHRLPPAESPAKTIFEAGTGAWMEEGGGESSDRYAVRASMRAEGKGC